MIAVLLFFAIGLYFVPNYAAHTIVFFLHAIWLLYFASQRFNSQPLTSMFTVAYVAMYFFNPVAICLGLMPLEGGTSVEVFFTANVLVLVGIDLFLIAATYLRRRTWDLVTMPHIVVNRLAADNVTMGIIIACGVMTAVLIVVVFALGVNIFSVDKSFRTGFGAHQIWFNATVFAFVLLPIAGFFIGLRNFGAQAAYLIVIASMLVLHFMIFRVRTVPIAFLIGYGIGFYAGYRHVTLSGDWVRSRVPAILKAVVVVAIPLGVVLGVGIKYARYSHDLNDYSLDAERFEYVMVHTFSGGDLGYTIFLRRAMEIYPDREPYLNGQSYYRLLFLPVPRKIWPSKPENTQRIFARALDPELGRQGVTIPPGIVGDLYINFGKLGVIGMLAFGFIFRFERYRSIGSLIFVAACGGWLFHFTRGALTNPLVWVFWILLAIWFVVKILKPTYFSRWVQYDSPLSSTQAV